MSDDLGFSDRIFSTTALFCYTVSSLLKLNIWARIETTGDPRKQQNREMCDAKSNSYDYDVDLSSLCGD